MVVYKVTSRCHQMFFNFTCVLLSTICVFYGFTFVIEGLRHSLKQRMPMKQCLNPCVKNNGNLAKPFNNVVIFSV